MVTPFSVVVVVVVVSPFTVVETVEVEELDVVHAARAKIITHTSRSTNSFFKVNPSLLMKIHQNDFLRGSLSNWLAYYRLWYNRIQQDILNDLKIVSFLFLNYIIPARQLL